MSRLENSKICAECHLLKSSARIDWTDELARKREAVTAKVRFAVTL